jgi:hypothetical protein
MATYWPRGSPSAAASRVRKCAVPVRASPSPQREPAVLGDPRAGAGRPRGPGDGAVPSSPPGIRPRRGPPVALGDPTVGRQQVKAVRRAHPSHSANASRNAIAPSSASVITHWPVTCGSRSMTPSRLVTTRLVKPIQPPCVLQVAWMARRFGRGRCSLFGGCSAALTRKTMR